MLHSYLERSELHHYNKPQFPGWSLQPLFSLSELIECCRESCNFTCKDQPFGQTVQRSWSTSATKPGIFTPSSQTEQLSLKKQMMFSNGNILVEREIQLMKHPEDWRWMISWQTKGGLMDQSLGLRWRRMAKIWLGSRWDLFWWPRGQTRPSSQLHLQEHRKLHQLSDQLLLSLNETENECSLVFETEATA